MSPGRERLVKKATRRVYSWILRISHANGTYDSLGSPGHTRSAGDGRGGVPGHRNVAGPPAFPAPGAPCASQRAANAHPRNRRGLTDRGLRVRHGRVLLELDVGAAAGGAVCSRGELRPRRTRLERSGAREPLSARQIAQDLHALLDAAGVPGPYVLVGHSFGGYVNRVFADLYRNKVVGMVLVDSLHPAEWKNPTADQLRMIEVGLRYAQIAAWLARLGFVRFCLARLARGSPRMGEAAASVFGAEVAAAVRRIAGEIRKLPTPILPVLRELWSQPKNFLSLGQHVAALPVSAVQAATMSSLGDLPLVVLSGNHHAAQYINWQRDLARLSSCGRHLVASDSGHWIHLDHPELVTQAFLEVVTAARSKALMEASAETPHQ